MHSPGDNSMLVCVFGRMVAPEEAVCHKARLALARGPTARAGGMKLKLTTQNKSERKSEREEEEEKRVVEEKQRIIKMQGRTGHKGWQYKITSQLGNKGNLQLQIGNVLCISDAC